MVDASLALDWKGLHERSDKLTLKEAILATKENPESLPDTYVLALVYLNAHKEQEAEVEFNKVLKVDPASEEARWGLAEILRKRHKLQEAEKILSDIVLARQDFSPAYISLAYVKFLQLDFQKAVQLSKKVIQQGEYGDADLTDYARAYAIFAGAKGIIAHSQGALSKLANGTAVLPALKKARELQPISAPVFFGLGSFYLLAPRLAGGDLAEAEFYLNKTVELDPLFPDVYVRLAQLYKLKKDNSKHDSFIFKALELDPQNELALDEKSGKCIYVCPDYKK
jgi:Tfp pilus assembly protein PilF